MGWWREGLIYFSFRLFIWSQLNWQTASRPWYNYNYISQTSVKIYDNKTGRFQHQGKRLETATLTSKKTWRNDNIMGTNTPVRGKKSEEKQASNDVHKNPCTQLWRLENSPAVIRIKHWFTVELLEGRGSWPIRHFHDHIQRDEQWVRLGTRWDRTNLPGSIPQSHNQIQRKMTVGSNCGRGTMHWTRLENMS